MEAILEAMLGSLRDTIPHLLPVVVSEDPDSTALAYDVGSVSNSDRQAVMAAVRDCDFVILGGGGPSGRLLGRESRATFFRRPAHFELLRSYAASSGTL